MVSGRDVAATTQALHKTVPRYGSTARVPRDADNLEVISEQAGGALQFPPE